MNPIRHQCIPIRHQCIPCAHPVEFHDRIGCTWRVGDHDICTCPVTIRDLDDDKPEPDSGAAAATGLTTGQEWV